MGYYTLSYAKSNTDGVTSNPSDPYNLGLDYGPSSLNSHHRIFMMGTIATPKKYWNLRFSPYISYHSGTPFGITTGKDLNGDSYFDDRPSFAPAGSSCKNPERQMHGLRQLPAESRGGSAVGSDSAEHCDRTEELHGESADEPDVGIRRGSGHRHAGGAAAAAAIMGRAACRGGGSRGSSSGGSRGSSSGTHMHSGGSAACTRAAAKSTNQRYNLTLSMSARNLFNTVNLANPVGSLSSPNFGESLSVTNSSYGGSSANNRRVELSVRFSF